MKAPDHSLGDGVYYDYDAYASFIRRLIVTVIDLVVILCIAIAMMLILTMVYRDSDATAPILIFFAGWHGFIWLYLTVVKRSKLRTVGYRLLRVKIVTTQGKRPSLLTMTYRMMMWVFGPFNILVDLFWLGADTEQQTLRDCYAGTYVVRNDADPIGTGPSFLAWYFGMGLALVYPRVVRPKQRGKVASALHTFVS